MKCSPPVLQPVFDVSPVLYSYTCTEWVFASVFVRVCVYLCDCMNQPQECILGAWVVRSPWSERVLEGSGNQVSVGQAYGLIPLPWFLLSRGSRLCSVICPLTLGRARVLGAPGRPRPPFLLQPRQPGDVTSCLHYWSEHHKAFCVPGWELGSSS